MKADRKGFGERAKLRRHAVREFEAPHSINTGEGRNSATEYGRKANAVRFVLVLGKGESGDEVANLEVCLGAGGNVHDFAAEFMTRHNGRSGCGALAFGQAFLQRRHLFVKRKVTAANAGLERLDEDLTRQGCRVGQGFD